MTGSMEFPNRDAAAPRLNRRILVGLVAAAVSACASPGVSNINAGAPTPSSTATPAPSGSATPAPVSICAADPATKFASHWIDGGDCTNETQIQIHRYDENTWILRQSMCTNFEGPFLYLLFGQDKVLLEDTGAGNIQVAAAVDGVINTWLTEHGRASIPLVVANSHAHGDHVAGNTQLAARANTTMVGTSVAQVQSFFGIATWPTQIAQYDLGGRVLDVIPIPGHQAAHIAFYDHATGLLLTGDTLYPGRLYVSDFPSYVQSIQRLVDATADKEVCAVAGTHIEMTSTPDQDFPFQSTNHPNEHPLQLTRAHLLELRDAVDAMQGNPQQQAHADFIIVP